MVLKKIQSLQLTVGIYSVLSTAPTLASQSHLFLLPSLSLTASITINEKQQLLSFISAIAFQHIGMENMWKHPESVH